MKKENDIIKEHKEANDIEPPPAVFGSWKNLYLLVIGNLVFLIILFYLFTRTFQ